MTSHIAARLHASGPKRMLALDGGGARGIVSLAFLEEIERTLQAKLGRGDDFVLADYFDMIGGTSVGSMIATLLALGYPVRAIRERFEDWAPRIFERKAEGYMSHVFDARRLRGLVQSEILDRRLSSPDLKTGLCIVTKRIDTGSVWPVVNNPAGPFFHRRPGTGNAPSVKGNGEYRLVDLIRASTAAPLYFSAAEIGIFDSESEETDGLTGTFVDGGVSPHNNPALLMFMMAGMSGYNFGGGPLEPLGERKGWQVGGDKLLIVSVGTGTFDAPAQRSRFASIDAAYTLQGMISDGQQLGMALLQWMSIPARSWHVDGVCGDLRHDLLGDGAGLKQPLLSFQRYDVVLENEWLEREKLIPAPIADADMERMRDFTNPDAIPYLAEIAERAAAAQVTSADFPDCFDKLWQLERPVGQPA